MEDFKEKTSGRVPVHVSIIMDGNGRWARQRGEERVYGHTHGVESVRACVEAAAEAGVRYLSLFAFSEENWGRPEAEVSTLMRLMFKAIADEVEALKKQGVRFRVLGDMDRLETSPSIVMGLTGLLRISAMTRSIRLTSCDSSSNASVAFLSSKRSVSSSLFAIFASRSA